MLSPLQPARWLDIIRQHCKCSCRRIENRLFVLLSSNAFRTLKIGRIPVSDLWSRKLNLMCCFVMRFVFFPFIHFTYDAKRVGKNVMFLIRFLLLLLFDPGFNPLEWNRIQIRFYIPNQIELFSLSQCSSSGRILMSSIVDNGFSSGNVSSRRCSGSLSCHVNKITKSIDSSPATIVYSFHGSTCFCSIGIKIVIEWKDEINKWNPTQIVEQLIMVRIYILICLCSVNKKK